VAVRKSVVSIDKADMHSIRLFNGILQGGPAQVKPTLLVTYECAGKIQ